MIKGIITDFDGTLADTYMANLLSYQDAFAACGLTLFSDDYKKCFGLRFDDFMEAMHVDADTAKQIKKLKAEYYKKNRWGVNINKPLYNFIKQAHDNGVVTAIASTASPENLMMVCNDNGLTEAFDYIIAGNEVTNGKPAPDVYLKALEHMGLHADEVLAFEDSKVGIESLNNAGINNYVICDRTKL